MKLCLHGFFVEGRLKKRKEKQFKLLKRIIAKEDRWLSSLSLRTTLTFVSSLHSYFLRKSRCIVLKINIEQAAIFLLPFHRHEQLVWQPLKGICLMCQSLFSLSLFFFPLLQISPML